LTRQLLAFSRKQPQALRVVEVNQVVSNIAKMLPRLIGEDIKFDFVPGEHLGQVGIDPVQLEQVLMNLAANARDALPQGGHLSIERSIVHRTSNSIQGKRAMIPLGRYTLITVADNGWGIPPQDLTHIFEPFYSTKPSGKGTGLGLAIVYEIAQQNHGFIWVYSEPGSGTVFKIFCLACRLTTHRGKASLRGRNQFLAEAKPSYWRKMRQRFVRLRGNFCGCEAIT